MHADGRKAVVDVDVAAVCVRCADGTGCGAGLFRGAGPIRRVEARIPPGLEPREGDTVRVALEPRDLLHAALAVYGPPLLGAATAAGIAYGLSQTDVETAAAALFGMAVGAFASRMYLKRPACLSRFVPTVERILGSPVPDG